MANSKALETSMLPQYQGSAAFMERFLVAAHFEDGVIERSPNNRKIKLVDGTELESDLLSYFSEHCSYFRFEFENELRERIGQEVFDEFCDVIANEWFDGMRLRQEGRSRKLKRSVHDYLVKISGKSSRAESLIQLEQMPTDVEPLIPIEAVAAILTVNDQMIIRHIEAWKVVHPNHDTLSSGGVFLRRGLALNRELDTAKPYREWDFLNSYSMAFSAPEQFAQITSGHLPATLNGELALFEERVLFFSPFIPGMDLGQLEFGIIPSLSALPIHFQGDHGGFLEYILDPAPYQK